MEESQGAVQMCTCTVPGSTKTHGDQTNKRKGTKALPCHPSRSATSQCHKRKQGATAVPLMARAGGALATEKSLALPA